jgi:hypothetical protein
MRQIQLVVVENMSGKAHIISIYGYPIGSIAKKFVPKKGTSSSGNKLVDLKSQFKDGTVRNMTAMGGLLKDIADIENHIEAQQEKTPGQSVPNTAAKSTNVAAVKSAPATVPPGIQNQNRTLSAKIPMGSDPNSQVP